VIQNLLGHSAFFLPASLKLIIALLSTWFKIFWATSIIFTSVFENGSKPCYQNGSKSSGPLNISTSFFEIDQSFVINMVQNLLGHQHAAALYLPASLKLIKALLSTWFKIFRPLSNISTSFFEI
jgi:hypothetical protein